jgi:diadenosine tetraphosphatase ApaH/serine/threonine PP2A family protein phosphatase
LEALLAVEEAIKKEGEVKKIFIGDVVGYGANPNECVEKVGEFADYTLAGNHDHAVLELTDTSSFNPYAKAAITWTKNAMTAANKKYLKSMKLKKLSDGSCFVHATPHQPEKWNYILTLQSARINFDYFDSPLCFIGHSHVPIIITQKPNRECSVHNGLNLKIEEGYKYIVNIGSVGQPRDGNPQASFAIYDPEEKTVQIKRVSYDISTAQKKIIDAGIPKYLADRLQYGR